MQKVVDGESKQISRFARNDGATHGKEKAIVGGCAADNRSLSHTGGTSFRT